MDTLMAPHSTRASEYSSVIATHSYYNNDTTIPSEVLNYGQYH